MSYVLLIFLVCACAVATSCKVSMRPLPAKIPDDEFLIVHLSTGLVVEAPKKANRNVFLAKWNGNDAQYFRESMQGDGYSMFINKENNYALDLAFILQNDVITWYKHGMSNQKWRPDGASLKSAYWDRGYVLEAQGLDVGSNLKGALPIYGSLAQQFVLVRAPESLALT